MTDSKKQVGVVEFEGQSLRERVDPEVLFDGLRLEPEKNSGLDEIVTVHRGDSLIASFYSVTQSCSPTVTVSEIKPLEITQDDFNLALHFLIHKGWAATIRSQADVLASEVDLWTNLKSLLPTTMFKFRVEGRAETDTTKFWALSSSADKLLKSFDDPSKYNLIRIG